LRLRAISRERRTTFDGKPQSDHENG